MIALAVGALFAVGASTVAAAVITSRQAQPPADPPAPAAGCNGMKELCGRRVNDVLFPGTHNSMSAADVPGWALANQRRSVPRQLKDGIRLFLLDPHYGRKGGSGRVLTDFAAEGRDRNKVARELDPPALAAVRRPSPALARGTPGPRDVWLCHTLCELGAAGSRSTLDDMKQFLAREPQNVLVLFLENYVTDEDLADAFRRTGTQGYAQALDPGEPLPTLGQMIRSGKRLLVFTENRVEGIPWLNDGFEWVQDTPLKAERPQDLNCRPSRGNAGQPDPDAQPLDRPLPAAAGRNRGISSEFLTRQIARCEGERQMPASFVAVDYYDTSGAGRPRPRGSTARPPAGASSARPSRARRGPWACPGTAPGCPPRRPGTPALSSRSRSSSASNSAPSRTAMFEIHIQTRNAMTRARVP